MNTDLNSGQHEHKIYSYEPFYDINCVFSYFYFIYLFKLYKAGRPTLKVCGLSVPMHCQIVHTGTYIAVIHILVIICLLVSVAVIRLRKLDEVGCLEHR